MSTKYTLKESRILDDDLGNFFMTTIFNGKTYALDFKNDYLNTTETAPLYECEIVRRKGEEKIGRLEPVNDIDIDQELVLVSLKLLISGALIMRSRIKEQGWEKMPFLPGEEKDDNYKRFNKVCS